MCCVGLGGGEIANALCFVTSARTHWITTCIPEIHVAFDQVYVYLAQEEERGNSQNGLLKVMATFVDRIAVTS